LLVQGVCEKTVQDIVERFWDIVEELSINRVLTVLKDNLVGAIIIVSATIWIPASCLISWVSLIALLAVGSSSYAIGRILQVDRKRRRQLEAEEAWIRSGELIHPSESNTRRVIHARLTSHVTRPSVQQR
jgi:disintegrin and metalloproteinase domain-containing protein 17